MTNQFKPRTMEGRKFYIVWNEAKNEGFATDDEQDAISCYRRVKRALSSTVGDAFAETYEDDELFLEVLDLPGQPPAQPQSEKMRECGWCGLKYADGRHFYDDTCNPCARHHGLEVPKDWKPDPTPETREDALREALEEVKRTLEEGQPAIACTVWCATKPAETLLDHVTAALIANGSAE